MLGNPAPPPSSPSPDGASGANGANGANGVKETEAEEGAEVINLEERQPPTEEDMFGPALESVQHLRTGVAGGLTPQQAVAGLLQGIAMCEQQEILVPAFTLFAEGRFADLWDALLPEAPQPFKDQCVQLLYSQFEADDDGDQPSPPTG